MKKRTETQLEQAVDFWQMLFDKVVASTPPESLFKLQRSYQSGADVRIELSKRSDWRWRFR
jgi:hypothetical protein